MDLNAYFLNELDEHQKVAAAVRAGLHEAFAALVARAAESIRGGGKLLFFGNGGSAADAQHLATELTVRYSTDRAPIAALALTTDSSALTAIGNDFSFDALFARQIEALGRPGDLAIAISTSGKSPNVLRGVEAAASRGLATAGLTGGDGGRLAGLVEIALVVPSSRTARIQEMHITLGQMLCGALEIELGLVGDPHEHG